MNVDLHDLLAGRADSVEPPVLDPLAVVAHGERLVRRRHRLSAAGAALALALAIGTTTLILGQGRDRAAPVDDPSPATGSRPLSYGQGQVIHLGDRQVDTGLNYLSLDITDDGAAFTTLDGGIWFTDGTGIEQIGATLGGTVEDEDGVSWVAARPRDWLVNDSEGSLLAWLEYPTRNPGQPELVVYDSARRSVVRRDPVDLSVKSDTARVVAVAGREVFLADLQNNGVQSLLRRYRVDFGTLEPVAPAVFEAARRGVPRALVVGASAQEGELMLHMGGFPDGFPGWLVVRDSRLDGLFDPHTGERLDVRVPSRYEGRRLYFVQWLDNDRFSLISDADAFNKALIGDLLTCRIAAGRCTVTIEVGAWDRGLAPPLLPGHGGIGADEALRRASAAAAG